MLSKCMRLKQELGLNFQQKKDDTSFQSSNQSTKSTPQQLIKKLSVHEKLSMAVDQELCVIEFITNNLQQLRDENKDLENKLDHF